jgi:hypothetical protein
LAVVLGRELTGQEIIKKAIVPLQVTMCRNLPNFDHRLEIELDEFLLTA